MAVTKHVSQVDKSQTPYQIDPEQVLRASQTLLRHVRQEVQKLQASSTKKNILTANDSDDEATDEDGDAVPVWLNITTKQQIVDKHRLKPSKIPVPHSLNSAQDSTICLITTDPQRAVKNAVGNPAFPTSLSARITKIISITKLTARYKSFEQRRQLLSEHDVFLADDRIISRLPKLLGKVFYKGTAKRPIPINMAVKKTPADKEQKVLNKKKEVKDAQIGSPAFIAAEISKALACVPVSLQPGHNISVRIGLSTFSPEKIKDNVEAASTAIIQKHVVKEWRNVRSIHIKSPSSMAIPVWLADDLLPEDEQVLSDVDEIVHKTEAAAEQKKRKRNPDTVKALQIGERKKARTAEDKEAEKAEKKLRKKKLADQKAAIVSVEA